MKPTFRGILREEKIAQIKQIADTATAIERKVDTPRSADETIKQIAQAVSGQAENLERLLETFNQLREELTAQIKQIADTAAAIERKVDAPRSADQTIDEIAQAVSGQAKMVDRILETLSQVRCISDQAGKATKTRS